MRNIDSRKLGQDSLSRAPPNTPCAHRHPYALQCDDILSLIPPIPEMDALGMHRTCQSRFVELYHFHAFHHKMSNRTDSVRVSTKKTKRNLIILDLDALMMHQVFLSHVWNESAFSAKNWESVNAEELTLDLLHWKEHKVRIGIFRKALIQFIESAQHLLTDIVLYSSALPDLVIFHAVMVEMYYNEVHAVRNGLDARFHFKQVLCRRGDIQYRFVDSEQKRKTLKVFNAALLSQYENVVIMDDQEGHMWSGHVPQEMVRNHVGVACLAPFPLSLELDEASMLTLEDMQIVKTMRESDPTFVEMIHLLQTLQNKKVRIRRSKRLVWASIDSLRSACSVSM